MSKHAMYMDVYCPTISYLACLMNPKKHREQIAESCKVVPGALVGTYLGVILNSIVPGWAHPSGNSRKFCRSWCSRFSRSMMGWFGKGSTPQPICDWRIQCIIRDSEASCSPGRAASCGWHFDCHLLHDSSNHLATAQPSKRTAHVVCGKV